MAEDPAAGSLGPYRPGPNDAPENGIYVGDCREHLRRLPEGSVSCLVTSPPYWGLRSYDLQAGMWGGSATCAHLWESVTKPSSSGAKSHSRLEGGTATQYGSATHQTHTSARCTRCGAWRGSLGLEPAVELYVEHLVAVFHDARRALHAGGTLWLNLGDAYQRKQLMGVPWRVALALQADGWWLRSDIIWDKTNRMPESVRDRPTQSHEYLFMLAKGAKYYYDQDAIREPYQSAPPRNARSSRRHPAGRNRRTVWSLPTQPYAGAHFAVFPPSLAEPCILAGCPPDGVVLDPFMGAGTTGLAVTRLGRRYLGFELNVAYAAMARERIRRAHLR